MKRNIKKLAVLVIITVIAPFIMAVMASAGPTFPQSLQGQYAVTSAGTVLMAPLGFDKNLNPTNALEGAWIFQTFNGGGVYTFNLDGTGRAEIQMRGFLFPFTMPNPKPPPPTVNIPPGVGASSVVFSFHYTITDDGKIIITADPGTYVNTPITGPPSPPLRWDGLKLSGSITYDGRQILANSGAPDIMSIVSPTPPWLPTTQIISNVSVVMTWRSW
jgi:hypothetical protein